MSTSALWLQLFTASLYGLLFFYLKGNNEVLSENNGIGERGH
jgi:hypothetical protein